jgi:hypothetical protein
MAVLPGPPSRWVKRCWKRHTLQGNPLRDAFLKILENAARGIVAGEDPHRLLLK